MQCNLRAGVAGDFVASYNVNVAPPDLQTCFVAGL